MITKIFTKYILTATVLLSLLGLSLAPLASHAAYGGLVICDGVVSGSNPNASTGSDGTVKCDFNYLVKTIVNVFNWFFIMTVPIAIGLLTYGGMLYITGVEGNIKKARKIFWNVALGFIIMLIAFTVIHTVLSWVISSQFGFDSATSLLKK
jgi:hypothetical protein